MLVVVGFANRMVAMFADRMVDWFEAVPWEMLDGC
jgi:hypothetical protein